MKEIKLRNKIIKIKSLLTEFWFAFFFSSFICTKLNRESKKIGEPRNHDLEEGFENEEGWHEIFNILNNILTI